MKIQYKCSICGAEYALNGFTNHIQRTHKIRYKEYYDNYIEPNVSHKCPFCEKECGFSNSRGYFDTCGLDSCMRKKQRETMLLRYGKSCMHKEKIKPKQDVNYKFYCEICGKGCKNHAMLNRHIIKEHKYITTEEYFLKYLNGKEKSCEICGAKAKWLGTHYHNICGRPECISELRKRNI